MIVQLNILFNVIGNKMKILGVIPARLASTRLHEKILLPIKGKPLLYYTARQVSKAKYLDGFVIAADDKRIVQSMSDYSFDVILTSKNHKSGTDRVGEIAKKIKADVYINIQGDEPLIPVENINKIAKFFLENSKQEIVTLASPLSSHEVKDPNNVKVVTDKNKKALYFSRSPIPYDRADLSPIYLKHIGIYGYTRNVLLNLIALKQTPLEKSEKLEQLRFLENGFKITVLKTNKNSIGVDTLEDFKKVKEILF